MMSHLPWRLSHAPVRAAARHVPGLRVNHGRDPRVSLRRKKPKGDEPPPPGRARAAAGSGSA